MGDLIGLGLYVAMLAAWITSLVNSVGDNDIVMAIVSILFFPAGVIHGIGVWLGLG